MKRWGRAVILFLALGALVNVGVAWGLALWLPNSFGRLTTASTILGPCRHDDGHRLWTYYVVKRVGAIHVAASPDSEIASRRFDTVPAAPPYWSVLHSPAFKDPDWPSWWDATSSAQTCVEDARGFPFRSMRSLAIGSWPHARFIVEGIEFDDNRFYADIVLPTRAIWPGFAANSLLYAIVLYIVAQATRRASQLQRHWCRRCIACGYDLRGAAHERCPECGAAVQDGHRRKETD